MDISLRTTQTNVTSMSLVRDFEVRHKGAVVVVPPIAQRLLCFVAIHAYPVRRPCVSGALWPDADERHASASLRSALWRVPSPNGESMVRTSASHIWLDNSVAVDLHGLVEASATMFQPSSPRFDWADVPRILWAYGHDLLSGWSDEWALVEREHFRQVRLRVLDQLGELLFREGRHHEAIQVALATVAAEPLRESAQRLLVRIHLHEGNIAEAFRVYKTYADQLYRELDASPSPVMTDLLAPYRRKRAQNPSDVQPDPWRESLPSWR